MVYMRSVNNERQTIFETVNSWFSFPIQKVVYHCGRTNIYTKIPQTLPNILSLYEKKKKSNSIHCNTIYDPRSIQSELFDARSRVLSSHEHDIVAVSCELWRLAHNKQSTHCEAVQVYKTMFNLEWTSVQLSSSITS